MASLPVGSSVVASMIITRRAAALRAPYVSSQHQDYTLIIQSVSSLQNISRSTITNVVRIVLVFILTSETNFALFFGSLNDPYILLIISISMLSIYFESVVQ